MSSSIDDKRNLITFEELKLLETEDIQICISKSQALEICENSTVGISESDIYKLWVKKLFKCYVSECSKQDWIQILEYMRKLLDKFIESIATLTPESSLQQLNLWWMDTLEFLDWLQSIIADLDMCILCLILAFGFDVVIRTCCLTDKRNSQPVATIHQQLIHILTNNMLNIDLWCLDDVEGLNKVLASLCEVASILSSSDIKLSIETWRIVTKIAGKCNESFKEIDSDCKATLDELRSNAIDKPIIGIIKELHKLFKYFLEDEEALNNDNFMKVAQFYLKLLKMLMRDIQIFPSVKELFDVYATFMHTLKGKTKSKIADGIQKDFTDILTFINQKTSLENYICQHLLDDNKEFANCDLILEYLRSCFSGTPSQYQDARLFSRLFDIIFDGPLFFVDSDKYTKVVGYFVNLTAEDESGDLHMHWCQNVIESSWIKAYTSCEILSIYYRHLFKTTDRDIKPSLEFWMQCWEKFNNYPITTASSNHQKYFIKIIISTIIAQLQSCNIEQYVRNYANWEIILLQCGIDNMRYISYLNSKLTGYLRKMNDKKIVRKEYTEMLNLLEIWCCHQQFVNVAILKDELVKAFLNIFSLGLLEMEKFRDFLITCFSIFNSLNNNQIDNLVLKCLQDNLNKTKSIVGAFMLEYLLNRISRSEPLLKSLQTPDLMKLQNFLENNSTKKQQVTCITKDLHVFRDAYNKTMSKSKETPASDVHCSKRPRVSKGDCCITDYKLILNEIFENSRKLAVNTTPEVFDTKDYELLNCIKQNIEICLRK